MVEGTVIFCSRCGHAGDPQAQFCSHCGASLLPAPPVSEAGALATAAPAPPAAVAEVPRYGGFWIRFLAIIIDTVIVYLVTAPVSFFLAAAIGAAGLAVRMPMIGIRLVGGIVGFTLTVLAWWIYEAALQSSSRQATVGKMVLGLMVTDLQGRRISFVRATGRHFAKYLSGLILAIGYIMAGFSERKQALHDILAGTLVRKTQSF